MIKRILTLMMPPIILILIRKIKGSIKHGWHGDYTSWAEAQAKSTGYESQLILDKVYTSLLKVKNGEAIYERDSVIFNEIQYSWQLLSGLMYAAAKNHGNLNVLDFGGSLGSTYYQNKKFLSGLESVNWSIIEQENFVECGRNNFANQHLHFYNNIDECFRNQSPTVLVLSSVLQYIEKPYELLEELLSYNFDMILIDRTPFAYSGKDTITLQTVPPEIYHASYPCWLFNENNFIDKFNGYKLLESFDALYSSKSLKLKGFIYELKE